MRVDASDEDTYIGALIKAAIEWCERFTKRSFVQTTWQLQLDQFATLIELPRPPLISVDQVDYVDTSGVSQTLASSVYQVDTKAEPGRLCEAYGQTWPTTRDQIAAVTITYKAGYGATAASVPDAIVHAVKLLVAHWFESREPVITGTIVTPVPLTVERLLWPYRVTRFS